MTRKKPAGSAEAKKPRPKKIVLEMIPIGERLRERREYFGASQTELAEALGVKPATYREWETARNNMAATYIPELARILDTPIGYFFREGEEQTKASQHQQTILDTLTSLRIARRHLFEVSRSPLSLPAAMRTVRAKRRQSR